MPARNSHSSGGTMGGKEITFFHTTDAGASIVMLVVTLFTAGSNLATCSASIVRGSIATQAARVGGAAMLLRRCKMERATSPPAIENGTASGTAITKQISPSRPKLSRASPISKGVIALTVIVFNSECVVFAFRNQEATNPVRNGTPRKRPQPYSTSTWLPKSASANPSVTAIATPKTALRGFPVLSFPSRRNSFVAISSVVGFALLGAKVSQRNSRRLAAGTKNKKIHPVR